jgi:DNA replication initiation complex subunit (GINS family)
VRLADSSKLTANLSQKLTIEERLFYENIYKNATDFRKQILGDK